MGSNADLLQGTLDLLILRTLAVGAMHGWGIAQRIQQVSNDVLQVGQGSLYPALHRLGVQGLDSGGMGPSQSNRRPRYYSLTARGKRQLEMERDQWDRMAAAITLVLNQAGSEAR